MAVTPKHIAHKSTVNSLDIDISFRPNSTSDPTVVHGEGYSVAYDSTGQWTITLDQSINGFVKIGKPGCRFASSDVDYHDIRVGDFSVANGTIEVLHFHSANTSTTHPVLADISSNAANWIDLEITVSQVSQPGDGVV